MQNDTHFSTNNLTVMKETVTNNISVVKESVMVIQLNVTSTEMAKVQDLVLKNVLKCVFLYGIKFPLFHSMLLCRGIHQTAQTTKSAR